MVDLKERRVNGVSWGKDGWVQRARRSEWVLCRAALKEEGAPFTLHQACLYFNQKMKNRFIVHSSPGHCPWGSFRMWPTPTWSHLFTADKQRLWIGHRPRRSTFCRFLYTQPDTHEACKHYHCDLRRQQTNANGGRFNSGWCVCVT